MYGTGYLRGIVLVNGIDKHTYSGLVQGTHFLQKRMMNVEVTDDKCITYL